MCDSVLTEIGHIINFNDVYFKFETNFRFSSNKKSPRTKQLNYLNCLHSKGSISYRVDFVVFLC